MPDYPPAVLAAAQLAIIAAATDFGMGDGTDQHVCGSAREFARAALESAGPVTEHAHMMSGGGYHVWNTEPYIEEIYPLAQRIEHGRRFGGKVYRRRVIVVEDWAEVAPATPEGGG